MRPIVPKYLQSDIAHWFRTGWGIPDYRQVFPARHLPVRCEWGISELLSLVSGGWIEGREGYR